MLLATISQPNVALYPLINAALSQLRVTWSFQKRAANPGPSLPHPACCVGSANSNNPDRSNNPSNPITTVPRSAQPPRASPLVSLFRSFFLSFLFSLFHSFFFSLSLIFPFPSPTSLPRESEDISCTMGRRVAGTAEQQEQGGDHEGMGETTLLSRRGWLGIRRKSGRQQQRSVMQLWMVQRETEIERYGAGR